MPDTNTAAPPGAAHRLRGENVVIVGPGRVGLSVGNWLAALGARIHAIAGRRRPSDDVLESAALGNTRWSPLESLRSDQADVLILAVADPALEAVAAELATRPQAPTVLHVSGHFDHRALDAFDAPDRRLGSWHPLRAFPTPSSSRADAAGVTWAIDGHPRACDL
ncbi:MAG: NAD(P)-dependent oxidoreductase, partial [Acidobacteriota bacterium]